MTEQLVPDIYNDLFSAPAEGSGAAKAGMTTKLDAYFYDIWWAAYLTSRLTPDWDKQITKTNAIAENKDGEYHAYLDLFTSEAAKIYLNGISFVPYGDWEYAGPTRRPGSSISSLPAGNWTRMAPSGNYAGLTGPSAPSCRWT